MAVYTDITQQDIQDISAYYNIGQPIGCDKIQEGVENSNFALHCRQNGHDTTYIFTIFEKRVNEADLPYYIALMNHLAAQKFPCPQPIKAQNGSYFFELYHKKAILVSFLQGKSVTPSTAHQFTQMGEYNAHWHNMVHNFTLKRDNALSLQGWQHIINSLEQNNHEIVLDTLPYIKQQYAQLAQNWPQNLPYGATHLDLFPNNVFFQDNKLSGIIDFYFSANDFFIYDIGVTISAWCFNAQAEFNKQQAKNYLQAYETIRPLQELERTYLPLMLRGSALRFCLTRLYDWVHTPKDAFVNKLDPYHFYRIMQCAEHLQVEDFFDE